MKKEKGVIYNSGAQCTGTKRKRRFWKKTRTLESLLGAPDSLKTLSKTDIVCLELVETNTGGDSGEVQCPHEGLAGLGNTVSGEVVDNASLEADVRVDEDGRDEETVKDGVEGAGSEGSNCQGNETGRKDALEAPVVAAVCRCWVRDTGGIVDYRSGSVGIASRTRGGRRTGALDHLGQGRENGAGGRGVESTEGERLALGQQLARQQSRTERRGHCVCVCVERRERQQSTIQYIQSRFTNSANFTASRIDFSSTLIGQPPSGLRSAEGKSGRKWKAEGGILKTYLRAVIYPGQVDLTLLRRSLAGGRHLPFAVENDDVFGPHQQQLPPPHPQPPSPPPTHRRQQWPRPWLPVGSL